MSDVKELFKIRYTDNPPDPAPPYPGKKSRNHPEGSVLTRHEFLQQHSDQWLQYVKDNALFKTSYFSDKLKCLKHHLRESQTSPQGITNWYEVSLEQCTALLKDSVQRLLPAEEQEIEHNLEKQQGDQVEQVELTSADNPKDPAPVYPGKKTDTNPGGSLLSRQDYLQQQTDLWFLSVKDKSPYRIG